MNSASFYYYRLDPKKIFQERVAGRAIVYLDQNVWIDLRQAETASVSRCLELCHAGLGDKKLLFPVSYPIWCEALGIPDLETRQRHCELLDALSQSVTLRSPYVLHRLEAKYAYRWKFHGESSALMRSEAYSRVPDLFGDGQVNFPPSWSRDRALNWVEEKVETPGFRSIYTYNDVPGLKERHDQFRKDIQAKMERQRLRRMEVQREGRRLSFADRLFEERQESLAGLVFTTFREECSGDNEADKVQAYIADLERNWTRSEVEALFQRMPAMNHSACLWALNAEDIRRRTSPNDLWDVEHASLTLHADIFVTQDRRLASLAKRSRPSARIIRNIPEFLIWLESFI